MKPNIVTMNILKVVEHHITSMPIKQGIIGIQLPGMVTTDELITVQSDAFSLPYLVPYDLQIAIIPPPLTGIFDASSEEDVKAIGGRVHRDRLDGIRYNRVYIALYWDDLGHLNAHHHDIFFNAIGNQHDGYRVSISDNREFGGDKFVVANQMKAVVSHVETAKFSDEPIDMMFSIKSLINRTDIPWWMELPEPVSDKTHLAEQLLAVINNNQAQLRVIESTVKEKLRLNEFDPSLVMTFAYPPTGISATLQPGGNKRNTSLKSVRLQIGSIYFYFGIEQGIYIDWVTLIIKQLECFINYPDLYDKGTV